MSSSLATESAYEQDYTDAFKLVEQARPFVAEKPRFRVLSARAVGAISVETTPPGAQVFIKDYKDLDAKWEPVGQSPIKATKMAQGLKRWKITLPEYESAEGTLSASFKPVELNVMLRRRAANDRAQTFTTLHSFTATSGSEGVLGINSDGVHPFLGLVLSGNTLYGAAQVGGSWGLGTVFAMSTDGTGFTNLHHFTATSGSVGGFGTNSDGVNPVDGLILSGNTLYGTTVDGGSLGRGTVFALNTDGTDFSTLHNFAYTDGARPFAGLLLLGNTLYGTAQIGGSLGHGTVFALQTDGTGFTTLHGFTGSDGGDPCAGLTLSGNTLYGAAFRGGTSGNGTVFAINADGTGFTKLHDFASYPDEGGNPYATLILSGNALFGISYSGGRSDQGTVFRLSLGQEAPH